RRDIPPDLALALFLAISSSPSLAHRTCRGYFLYPRSCRMDGGKTVVALPQRQMLSDGVYEAIKRLLMEHTLPPASRVNIDQLARQLNVSPTPVREALARLEADALVVKEPLRGYTAAPLLDLRALEEHRE